MTTCKHERRSPGTRMPLLYGSSATEVCDDCGVFRLLHHGASKWQPGPLADAIRQANEEESA